MILQRLFWLLRARIAPIATQLGRPTRVIRQVTQQRAVPVTMFTAMGLLGFMKKEEHPEKHLTPSREILLAKVDALFDRSEFKKICEVLDEYRESKDVEILWRMSRALYKLSQLVSEDERKKMIYDAYTLLETALGIDANHFAVHKWMSVLLDAKSSCVGMKSRLKELYNVKQHLLRASELNPKDATTWYMLGSWCFGIAGLAWYQRKIAATLFAEPPQSSYEEALSHFLAAERAEPNFYSQNLLMLGKTYLQLGQKDEALRYLKMVSEYQAKNDDDHEAKREALKLLNGFNKS